MSKHDFEPPSDVRPPPHAQDYQDDDLRGLLRDAGFNTYSPAGREMFVNYMRANLERNIRDQKLLAFRQKTFMGILALTGAGVFAAAWNIIRQLLPERLGKWMI